MISDQLHRFDGELYSLLAYTIMSNHVHILIDTSIQIKDSMMDESILSESYQNLDQIMKRIIGATASYGNKLLNKTGQFWERESFDRYIRNERMLHFVISYILENPVKANLVEKWDDYPWSYWKIST